MKWSVPRAVSCGVDERRKPLAAYRVEELSQMSRSFFGPNPAYHEARHWFVHKGVPVSVLQGRPSQPGRARLETANAVN